MQTLSIEQTNQLQEKHKEIINARAARQAAALKTYVESSYPNLPKSKLENLQFIINLYEKKLENEPDNVPLKDYVQSLKDKVANEDYLKPNTPDMEYHDAYHAHVQSFVWPSQEELEVRAVEDLVLTNLQESFNANNN